MNELLVVAHGKLRHGSAGRIWARAESRLKEIFGNDVEIRYTAGAGDAVRLTRAALKAGSDWIAAAGGDGTTHEVVNGFFDGSRNIRPTAALSFIPCGSGNDWARTLGIPLSAVDAASALPGSHVRPVDVGQVTYTKPDGSRTERIFLNVAEAGVGGELVSRMNSRGAIARSRIGYRLGTIEVALTYPRPRLNLALDGAPAISAGPVLSLIVAGGQYFGAGMKCAPTASPDDGLLEVVVIGDFGAVELLRKIHRFFSGTHLSEPKIFHASARSVEVSSDSQVLLELDGELVGALPASFRVLPGVLAVRY